MSLQNDIADHLNQKLGITVPELEPVPTTPEPVDGAVTPSIPSTMLPEASKQPDFGSFEREVGLNIKKVEELQDSVLLAHKDLVDTARNYNKDRSYEVLAKLTDSLTNLAKTKNEMLRDMYGKNDLAVLKKGAATLEQNNTTQNIFVGSFRELIDQMPKTVIVRDQNQQENNVDESQQQNEVFQLHIKKENKPLLDSIKTPYQYRIRENENTIDLIFDSAKVMNKMKFEIIETHGQGILI